MARLRALLDDPDRGPQYVGALGSSAAWLRQHLAEAAGGKNPAVKEGVERMLLRVQAVLEGPQPSPLERLLAERAAACWFVVHLYESMYVRSGAMTLAQADYKQKLIDRAHRRFLSALRTLATVRKLGPAVLVNIAFQQVNSLSTTTT